MAEIVTVTYEEAVKRLKVVQAEHEDADGHTWTEAEVHTLMDGGFAAIGADWDLDKLLEAMQAAPEIRETQGTVKAMGHGLVIDLNGDPSQPLFIETKEAT